MRNATPVRAQATIIGQLLAPHAGEVFVVGEGRVTLRADRPRKGYAPVYWFEAVES